MPGKPTRRRHPINADHPPGTWNPKAVGVVTGYPATAAAFDAQLQRLRANSASARAAGRLTRKGVPNGWRGTDRRVLEELRSKARADGWKVAEVLNEVADADDRVPADSFAYLQGAPGAATTDAERSALALAILVSLILDPTIPAADRLRAARIALPYLRPLASAPQTIALDGGVAWLVGLAAAEADSPP